MKTAHLVITVLMAAVGGSAAAKCSVSDVSMKSTKARWVKESYGTYMKGVAVLTNKCSEAVGVQVQITGFDPKGDPVSTRDFWPASIRNIAPGDYTFSLDQALEPDASMKTFDVKVISVKEWR